jgi:ATP-dependent DNA helicase RecG
VFNTLVHADYLDRASIRIQKWPSGFEFRNPGVLRVPAELALQGGESDCRNRTLHQMFLMLGLGERAGSGLPKIRAAWENAGFKVDITDTFEPYDQTLLRIEQVGNTKTTQKKTTQKKTTQKKTTQKTIARQQAILEVIQNNPHASRAQIADALGDLTADGVKYHLQRLQQAGVVERIGADKGGYWQVVNTGEQADE